MPPFAARRGSILRSGGGGTAPPLPTVMVEEEGLRAPRTALASLPVGGGPAEEGWAPEVEPREPNEGGVEPYKVPSSTGAGAGPRLLPAL